MTLSHTSQRVKDTIIKHVPRARMVGPDNMVGLCPFHDDSSPSFSMNIHNGLFICFACDVRGTFRKFLTLLGMNPSEIRHHFGKTLEDLKANAPPPPDPTHPEIVADSNEHIPEELLGIFHRCPDALLDEGFEMETLREFGVGVDVKHSRITFPLRDLKGNLVGISGRAMNEDQEPRYKVYEDEYKSFQLPSYRTEKSHLVWNAHSVYANTFRTPGRVPKVIVEGFKACMWLKQAGVPHVVALMTKTMSWTQKLILTRMGGPYILMLDNDDAGIDGTIKVSRELIEVSTEVRIVEYDARQPTDVPLEDVLGVVESATDYNELALD